MTTAFPEALTAAPSGAIPLPGPETVIGLPQLPVGDNHALLLMEPLTASACEGLLK